MISAIESKETRQKSLTYVPTYVMVTITGDLVPTLVGKQNINQSESEITILLALIAVYLLFKLLQNILLNQYFVEASSRLFHVILIMYCN